MLQAMLRRKLTRAEEGMEDLLTSNTFGMLKYLPPEVALFPFLRAAVNPLTGATLGVLLNGVARVDQWRFWPRLAYSDCIPCEPDVELCCSGENGAGALLLVEAKYRTGKSSLATEEEEEHPNDQLAREYDNGTRAASAVGLARCAVVYITTDAVCPEAEVRESAAEYRTKRGYSPDIYWTSWRFLPAVLEPVALAGSEMARDLRELLLRMELTTYCRLRFTEVKSPEWDFQRTLPYWFWGVPVLAWRFDGQGIVSEGETPNPPDAEAEREFKWELSRRPNVLYQWGTL